MGHKCWQYWPTEEPGFQKLYETGLFLYDFGLIPFIALNVKFTTWLLSVSQSHALISVSVWRLVLFQHTDAIWHRKYFKDNIQGVPVKQS